MDLPKLDAFLLQLLGNLPDFAFYSAYAVTCTNRTVADATSVIGEVKLTAMKVNEGMTSIDETKPDSTRSYPLHPLLAKPSS